MFLHACMFIYTYQYYSYLATHWPPTSHLSFPVAVFSSALSSLPPTLSKSREKIAYLVMVISD